ncbi:DUF6221 family protein [Actinopolymorpha sp. B17G11]
METIDGFLLKRVADHERRAVVDYNKGLSQLDLDRALGTCHARRQLVTLYRTSVNRQEARCAYALVVAIVAELYDDHPDYDEDWRPIAISAAHLDEPCRQRFPTE